MINKAIKFSLNNRLTILFIFLVISMAGLFIVNEMDVDVFPDLNAPTVVVMTEAHGMAPEEVERLVTFPIETAINGASNVRRVRSSSSVGFSIVWVEFDWDIDVLDARQIVSEKITTVTEQLPEGIDSPVLAPQSSLLGEIMIISLSSDSVPEMELRTFADWVIRPRLLSLGGVAQVTVIGGELKQYQIMPSPLMMNNYNVSLQELLDAVESANLNVSGGFFNEFGNEYIIRGMARTNKIEELGNYVIKQNKGHPVLLSDVAEIKIGPAPKIGSGAYRGDDAVVLTITKQPDINTIKLTEKLNKELSDIEDVLPPNTSLNREIFEQASFIKVAVDNIFYALVEGGVLVIIILFIFLMNVRSTVISVIAIPLSLLVAVIILKLLGITLNTMTLGGMAIAIGSIVDDAIIDVENAYKRLKENMALPKEQRKISIVVIYEASKEIRSSILIATLIIIAAFIPLFFLSGMEGRMLQPLGIAYVVSLLASLVVAVTVVPVMISLLMNKEKFLLKHIKEPKFTGFLKKIYEKTLTFTLEHKYKFLISTLLVLIVAVIIFAGFGRNFLPAFNEGSLAINIATTPGISLEESNKIGVQAEKMLLSIPEVQTTSRKTGRAELAEHSFGVNVSEIEVPFILEERTRSEFLKDVRAKLSSISGITFSIGQPISHRIDHLVSGSATNIALKIFGTDILRMYNLASEIKSEIESVPGIADLMIEQQVEIPQIQIKPKTEMLARYGIKMPEFLEQTELAFGGVDVGDVFEEERAFDLIVRFPEDSRNSIEAIKNTLFQTADGQNIPLSLIAEVNSSFGPNTIKRENVRRMLLLTANVADRDVRSVVNDIAETVKSKITMPEGYYIEYSGQFESEAAASRTIFLASLAVMLLIFLLLYQEFRNLKIAGIILLNLPLALIGGVIIIALTGNILSIPSLIGFITLFGIATRNGILLVSRYRMLSQEGIPMKEAIVKGSIDRLNPILMTALTAALALIPLAVTGDKPGNEIQSPMAQVILGGLLSSTVLNLLIIPIVYYLMNMKKELNFVKNRLD